MTKGQLLEIWKNGDHMDLKDFDPKVFFMLHGKTCSMQRIIAVFFASHSSICIYVPSCNDFVHV